MDVNSQTLEDENLIDSLFYFDVLCMRWLQAVTDLRQRIFGTAGPPHPGMDPEYVLLPPDNYSGEEFPRLIDPFRKLGHEAFQILQEAVSWDDAGQLVSEAAKRIATLRVRPRDVELWWPVSRLGEAYRLHPEDVWVHVVAGWPVLLPLLDLEIDWDRFTPRAVTLRISDVRALPKDTLGDSADQGLRRWMAEPLGGKERRESTQRAGNLVRTWCCLCLEQVTGLSPLHAVQRWNAFFETRGLAWGGAGYEAYSGDKARLRRRLGPLLNDELLLP